MVKTVVDVFGIAGHVAVAYLHQTNVLDVLPVDTPDRRSGTTPETD